VQLPSGLVNIINANILNNNNGYNIDIQDANICQGGGATTPVTGFAGSPYVGR
jgi:hypothetical protein